MKPLLVLILSFLIALGITRLTNGQYEPMLSARIAMAIMLVFTSIAHFAFTRGMIMMMPAFIPFKKELVYGTGFIEVIAAAGLLIPGWQHATGWLLIVFFIILLPANINAAINHVDYQKGTMTGNGAAYLWFRVPLQLLFIGWVYLSAIRA
jgi:uncharacterized membrane protein